MSVSPETTPEEAAVAAFYARVDSSYGQRFRNATHETVISDAVIDAVRAAMKAISHGSEVERLGRLIQAAHKYWVSIGAPGATDE